jgi:(p)ppGpp synthase/HD superfamily hydrolase
MPSLLGTAILIAAQVHEQQYDKADAPYMLHCIAVMQLVAPDEDAMIVAVLHDAIEDSPRGFRREEVRHDIKLAFPPHIFEAIDAMTHRDGESYDEYIERVAVNYLARKVKIADLTHNLDPRRIPSYQIVDKDFERWSKYRSALVRLERGD